MAPLSASFFFNATPGRILSDVARPMRSRLALRQRQQQQRRPGNVKGTRRRAAAQVQANLRNIDWPEALLFDCDGVSPSSHATMAAGCPSPETC